MKLSNSKGFYKIYKKISQFKLIGQLTCGQMWFLILAHSFYNLILLKLNNKKIISYLVKSIQFHDIPIKFSHHINC